MKINRTELLSALERVKPGLANKELVEQATSFAFMGDRVVTYNDEISVSHPVTGLDITGAVKAQPLYTLLSKIKRDEIELECQDNQVIIQAGKSKAGLAFEHEVRLPVTEVGKIGEWHDIPDRLLDGLKFCHPCCSRDMSRPILTCVCVKGSAIYASDSYQIVRFTLPAKVPVSDFLIPASSAKELLKYAVKQVAEGQGWIHFRTEDGTVFSARTVEGEFPNVDQFLEFDGPQLSFPKTAIQALDRARVFAQSEGNSGELPVVTVAVSPNQITFRAKNEIGWFEESVKTAYSGPPIKFVTGVEFLINVLERSPSCVYGEDKIKFAGNNWVHVIASTSEEEPK